MSDFNFGDYILQTIILFVILTLGLVISTKYFSKKSRTKKLSSDDNNEIIKLLGGKDNIVSYESKLSRISIIVNDPSIVDTEAIKTLSGCGLNVINNKIQLILKENREGFENVLTSLETGE